MKHENSQGPWKEAPERKVEIDMGQFSREWVQNYERSEKLLEKTVARLDAGENVTSDELRQLFASTSEEGVEEIEREREKAEDGYMTPQERDQWLLSSCSLNIQRHLRSMPVQERLKNSGQPPLPEPKITPEKSLEETINFLNDRVSKKN